MGSSKNSEQPVIIAIDGPAGAGKSTTAKELARRLKFSYLDTGAMYRALTLKALRHGISLENEEALVALANKTSIDVQGDGDKPVSVFLDGKDVSQEIRSAEVTNNTFYIARAPRIREIMVKWQQHIGESRSIVVEGRDIGTVVFPSATRKFYLDADFEERSRRRLKELIEQGKKVEAEVLKAELRDRDHKDFSRKTGPLRKASDAIVIDSTGLTITQTVDKMMQFISNHG